MRDISAAMFSTFLKAKFSGPGCGGDRAVDWQELGAAVCLLENTRAGGGLVGIAGFGVSISVDAIGNSGVSFGFPGVGHVKRDGDNRETKKEKGTNGNDAHELEGHVFRRDGLGGEGSAGGSGGWSEFGVARRSLRATRGESGKGPVQRPDVDSGFDRTMEEHKANRSRAQRLGSQLKGK